MAQGVHGQVDFRALFALVSVVAGPAPALRRAAQRPAVKDGRRRLGFPPFQQAQDHPQIVRHGFQHAGLQPALGLLIDRFPGRKVAGQVAPRRPRVDQIAQRIEDFAQFGMSLRRIFTRQRQTGSRKGSLFLGNIARIRLAAGGGSGHGRMLPRPVLSS